MRVQTIESNYILEYYDEIKKGNIIAGNEMKTLLRKLIREMKSEEYRMDFREADIRIDFIEHNCKLTKAEFYGQPFILELWEKAFITAVYGFQMYRIVTLDDDRKEVYGWVRRFTEVLLLLARKNGKSELQAALAFADLILAGRGMDICVGSNDDEQSKILFMAVSSMREQADPKQRIVSETQKIIRCKNKNTIFRMSEKMRNIEGRLLARGYIDEVCMMNRDAKIARAIIQSTSVLNDPLITYITSEGMIIDGYLDYLTDRGRKILREETDGDKRFLPWFYTQDETEAELFKALDDPDGWRIYEKSNPNLGKIKKISYLIDEMEKAKEDRAHKIWVLNKDFTMKQSTSVSFLDYDNYAYKQEKWTLEDFRGCVAIYGVDLAETTDLNAITMLLIRLKENGELDDTFYVHNMFFIPSEKLKTHDDNFDYEANKKYFRVFDGIALNTEVVADYMYEMYQTYGIIPAYCGYDMKFDMQFRKKMEYYGFEHEVILQNSAVLNNAIRHTEKLFLHKKVNYNNNPVMQWNISNAALQVDSKGMALLVKANNDRRNRIDGIVSFVIAIETYNRHRAEFQQYAKRIALNKQEVKA